MGALDIIRKVKEGRSDPVHGIKDALSEARAIDKEYHYFLHLNDDAAEDLHTANNKGRLYGLAVSIKDCICVKGMESKAGSNILEGYKPAFDATVVKRIRDEGGVILGKTSQDVFGFGSFNVNVGIGYPVPKNPLDKERTTGGSSGGAAGITKKLPGHIAISESTGGSIACPASYCGVYGMTPTYGRVSRYGLIDYANSLDKIGVMANDIEEIALMLDVLSGYDEMDSTSVDLKKEDFTKKDPKHHSLRIGLIKESLGEGVEEGVRKVVTETLKDIKHDICSQPLAFRYGIQSYYLLSMSEASTNLAKLCGMRYGKHEELSGNFDDYFTKVRSRNFSKEAKRRIIIGTFARMSGFRDAYYLKALKVRAKIIQEYKDLFRKHDILVCPTMPNIAPRFSEIEKLSPLQNYMIDIMTAGPNLAGLPHLSIPVGSSEGMPVGLLVIADHFQEKKLIDFARQLI